MTDHAKLEAARIAETDTIRSAAARLRQLATAAAHNDRADWTTGHTLGTRSPVVIDDPQEPTVLIETYAARLEDVNAYVAAMDPATGSDIADWLGATADAMGWLAPYREHENGYRIWTTALVVARKVLA